MALQVWLPLNGDLTNNGVGNYTITNVGATVNNSGKLGKCYDFTGSTSRICSSDLGITSYPISICTWIKLATFDSNSQYFISNNTSGGTADHAAGIGLYNNKWAFWAGGNYYTITNTVATDVWHHMTVTIDENKHCSCYFDGQIVIDTTCGNHPGSKYLTLGARSTNSNGGAGGASYYMNGYLNDVRFYDHCLSPKEVEILARGLVLHYPITGGGRGGDNLLANSIPTSTSGWSRSGTDWTRAFVDAEGSLNGKAIRATYEGTGTTRGGIYHSYTPSYESFEDGSYTLTARIRASLPCRVRLYNRTFGLKYVDVTTEWSTYSVTGTTDKASYTDANSYILMESSYVSQGVWIECCMIKFEKGDKSTPWIPYPTDAEYTSMGYNNNTEYDVSGYLHNGTINGSVSYSSDTARYSVSTKITDGRTNYISAPITIGDGTAITMNAWVKSLSGQTGFSDYHIVLCIDGGYFEFSIPTTGKFRQGFYVNNTRKVDDCGTTNLLDTNWHMLTATFDGTSIKRYVDGTLVNTTSASDTLSTGLKTLYIGKYNTNEYGDRNLLTSDVRIYATALTPTQIAELYNTALSLSNNGTLMGYELIEN